MQGVISARAVPHGNCHGNSSHKHDRHHPVSGARRSQRQSWLRPSDALPTSAALTHFLTSMASPTRRKNINGSNSPNYNRNDSFDSTTFTSAIRRNDTANAFNRKIRTASAGQGSITPVGGWIKQPFQSDLDDQPYPSNSTQDSEPLSSHPLSSSSSTHDLNHDHRSTSRSVTRKRRSSDDSWSGDIFAETVRGKRKEEDDREVIVHEVNI